jgi:hypothetical protein
MMRILLALSIIFSLNPTSFAGSHSETIINGKKIVCCKCGDCKTYSVQMRNNVIIAYCVKCFALRGK